MCIYVNSYRVVFPSPYQYHFHSELAARCGSSYPILRSIIYSQRESMEKNHRRQSKSKSKAADDEEVSSIEWESIVMSEQEEDLIYRMHKLVGDRWDLIAGRIPGRTAEQVERFWIMRDRHGDGFAYAWRREEAKPKPKLKRAKYGVFIR